LIGMARLYADEDFPFPVVLEIGKHLSLDGVLIRLNRPG
jgi:hypothetical protein